MISNGRPWSPLVIAPSSLASFHRRLLQVLRQGEGGQEIVEGAPAVEEEGDQQARAGRGHQGGFAGGGESRRGALLRQAARAEVEELAAGSLAVQEDLAKGVRHGVDARMGEAELGEL